MRWAGGVGRTQEKEAMTQFPYLLEDSQKSLCCSYSCGCSVGGPLPVGFCKKKNQCSVFNLGKSLGETCRHAQCRAGGLLFDLQGCPNERRLDFQSHP